MKGKRVLAWRCFRAWAIPTTSSFRASFVMSAARLLVILVVVHRGDGVEHLLVVVVHAEGVASLGQDDQEP